MGLKPDHWIRKMALEHGMIEPFEEKQVREGVISYGLSSYGYDMRVADEFRIFTNVFSTVVDPKNFSPQSMVEYQGEVCIVPPNSFALARSVEYFRIPRSVLTLTVGKSTYARCFRGDTKVALVDGRSLSLEEMAIQSENGELFWGYSVGLYGRVMVTLLEAPRYIGRDSLVEVVLDNDQSIFCTPDHIFIKRDGQVARAADLRPNDSLMPLYRQVARGYEMVYQPLNGQLHPTHRLADEWNVRNQIYDDIPGTHRHHIDHDRRNNNPWNITRMDATEHIRHHNAQNFSEDFDPDEHSMAVREAIQNLWDNDPEWRARFSASQREKMRAFWHDENHAEARAKLIAKRLESWTDERRTSKSLEMQRYFSDPSNRLHRGQMSKTAWERDQGERREMQREIARKMRIREEITAELVRAALDETGSIRGAERLLDCDRSVFRRFPEVVAAFRGTGKRRNHKVIAIKELRGDHDVYCLTVPEAGNFALDAGVFVSNCGIITNITPFEPGWEGFVTLEISNTTPLPAKIYANEGIAQVIFLEADEECEVSYADRKGKYQGQTGVTPPRL
jgi:dCTP deaminase